MTIWKPLTSASGDWECLVNDGTLISDANPSAFLGKVIAKLNQIDRDARQHGEQHSKA